MEILTADLLFLQHELAESLIMNGTMVEWRVAHDMVNEVYNWDKSISL